MASERTSLMVALFAVAVLAIGGLVFALQVLPLSSGAIVGVADNGYTAEGAVVFPLRGADTAFEAGDVVASIAGADLTTWPAAPGDVPTGSGATVPASVIRAGEPVALTIRLDRYPLADYFVSTAGTMTFAVVLFGGAAYVFSRRRRDYGAIGLLVFALGIMASTPAYLAGVDSLAFARGQMVLVWLPTVLIYFLIWSGGLHFALAFPRPHPWIVRRPRLLLAPYVLVYGSLAVGALVSFNLGLDGLAPIGVFSDIGNAITIVAMLGFIALMGLSWRRAGADERHMLRGLVVTGLLAVLGGIFLQYIPEIAFGAPVLPWAFAGVLGVPFALALAAAVLRHGAFDIDVVVKRSLVYGGMTIGVLTVYAAVVAALGAVFQDAIDETIALFATALAALAALPIRDIVQRAVDRGLYGDRDEPVRAMRRLGQRLALTMDPQAVPEVITNTVADSLRLPYVALAVGGPDDRYVAATRGEPPADPDELVELPLVSHSALVGALRFRPREPGESMSAADMRLLDDLARQAGPAVDNLALDAALRRSRERIVIAGEEERRRLRRDLHDGLGPTLAATGMQLEAAAGLIDDEPEAARGMLDDAREGVRTSVADVRRLVDGLRPPALDELGLVGALGRQGERLGAGMPVFLVESESQLDDLPAAIEVAAYRIATEAMTNVARHAEASRCQVKLSVDGAVVPESLRLQVIDDGRGIGPDQGPGVGLTSMRERAAEVGGRFSVEHAPAGGTRVQAWLPLGAA